MTCFSNGTVKWALEMVVPVITLILLLRWRIVDNRRKEVGYVIVQFQEESFDPLVTARRPRGLGFIITNNYRAVRIKKAWIEDAEGRIIKEHITHISLSKHPIDLLPNTTHRLPLRHQLGIPDGTPVRACVRIENEKSGPTFKSELTPYPHEMPWAENPDNPQT
jgi:hypothetical protein